RAQEPEDLAGGDGEVHAAHGLHLAEALPEVGYLDRKFAHVTVKIQRLKRMYNAVSVEGLRERKKRQTRDAIAAAALALFRERGFDAVTVADVARAADVSEKTVFNHFPAKEDLVFAHSEDRLDARAEAIRLRPPGVPLIRVFEAETMAFL